MSDSRRHTPAKKVLYVDDPQHDAPREALLEMETDQKAWIVFPDEITPPDEGPPTVAKIVPVRQVFEDRAAAYRWMIEECTRGREEALIKARLLEERLERLKQDAFIASCLKE